MTERERRTLWIMRGVAFVLGVAAIVATGVELGVGGAIAVGIASFLGYIEGASSAGLRR